MHSYSSIQIFVPDALADEIVSWGELNIIDNILFEDPENKWFGREYEPHITIISGLHESTPTEIQKLVTGIPPLEITLDVISTFAAKNYDIIKITIKSPSLLNLNKKLTRLPHTKFFKEYKPHITIAYVKKDYGLKSCAFQGKTWTTNSIIFSSKRGHKTTISFDP